MTQNLSNIDKLKFMAEEFNPFASEVSEEMRLILKELGLDEFMENPFTLSNEILKRLHAHDLIKADSKNTLQ